MLLRPVATVSYFVDDLDAATTWYSTCLDRAPARQEPRFVDYDLGSGATLTLHVCDEHNGGGPAGAVAYWDVDDLDAMIAVWTGHGATTHRDPRTTVTGERVCQLRDPFDNLVGLRQPAEVPSAERAPAPALSEEALRAAERTASDAH